MQSKGYEFRCTTLDQFHFEVRGYVSRKGPRIVASDSHLLAYIVDNPAGIWNDDLLRGCSHSAYDRPVPMNIVALVHKLQRYG